MPLYYFLKHKVRKTGDRNRVVENLQKLRKKLDRDVPSKDADDTLLLASWNIRDFGKPGERRGFGRRRKESLFYIAEVLSRFDFVAVQEVNELDEWDEVMDILGRDWDYIATDVTDTSLGGNGERLLYCFDRRKLSFRNIAGEIVLPAKMLISGALVEGEDNKTVYTGKQFRRTPFVASFQSGWFKFDICTVHIYFGKESGSKLDERVEEIARVAEYFGKRADRALRDGKSLILLGDFNIVHPEHKTMKALTDQGFVVPKTLSSPTNFSGTKYYDQIAFKEDPEVLEYIERSADDPKDRNAGILDLTRILYKAGDWQDYKQDMLNSPNGSGKTDAELKKYFKTWRTYQLSDHRPLWVRLNANDSEAYLESLRT